MAPSFQIGSKELCHGLPTHLIMLAERAGDSESASWPCPTAGDQVVTAIALVWENLRTGEPSTLGEGGQEGLEGLSHDSVGDGVWGGW